MHLLCRLSIWVAALWLATAAVPASARTSALDFVSTNGSVGELHASDALATRFVLTPTPLMDLSMSGGFSADTLSIRDLSRRIFLTGDARVELAGGRWIQTLHAGYTDHHQEHRESVDPYVFDVARLRSGTRLTMGALNEIRLSPKHTLALGAGTRRETLDEREQIRMTDSDFVRSWSYAESRTHSALVESRLSAGGWALELGGRLEDPSAQRGRLRSRIAGSYVVPKWETRIFAAVGSGFADPSRLEGSLAAAIATRGDAALAPQVDGDSGRSRSWRLGLTQRFARGKIALGAAVAQTRSGGPVEPLGGMVASLELGALARGTRTHASRLDAFIVLTPLDAAKLEITYAATAAELREARNVDSTARHVGRADLTLTPLAGVALTLTMRYVGPRREPVSSRAPSAGGESYSACDFAASHVVSPRLRVVGRIENLLHREHEARSGERPPVLGSLALQGTF